MIQQSELKEMRNITGIKGRQVSHGARIDNARYSLIETMSVTARPDEMERIEAALLRLIGERLTAIRSLETDRGLKLANA